jgi:dihydropteroate synthase
MLKKDNLVLKRMGVMNITPNSFSDGRELDSSEKILARLTQFGEVDALDVGAESTAPMNESISTDEEWQRLETILPYLKYTNCPLSLDTYHVETIFKLAHIWKGPLIWNDVSGKFDQAVLDFLKLDKNYRYVFCHNLAPTRELSAKHMNYLSEAQDQAFLNELALFFAPYVREQVLLDPCLGFSKTYEQNWYVLEHFEKLQQMLPQSSWLLGFSRKSFLKKKYQEQDRERLDQLHLEEISRLKNKWQGEVWIRTHRPELI